MKWIAAGLFVSLGAALVFAFGSGVGPTVFAALLGLAGVAIVALGVSTHFYAPTFADPANQSVGKLFTDPKTLTAAMDAQDRPFWVCTECRVLYDDHECHGMCLRCDTIASLHRVHSDSENELAKAAVR